jgi:hypothetical protein
VTPDEAVVTITDATGTTYQGVRFAHDATGWNMVPASTCRLPDADPVACATVEPEVRFTPGRRRLDSTAYGGAALPATALAVDPNRYVEGPLISAGRLELAAAYERAGTGRTVPPSYVVGFPPDATTGSVRADLEGEILSFADGGSVVWAVTHDLVVDSDRVEYRLKRIDTATGRLTTMPLPPGAVPAGPVAASESGAWVPVRDGVIPFAPDGAALTRFALPEQETRNVAIVDGQVYATAGTTIRRLGENGNAAAVVLDTGGPDALTGLVATDTSVWALAGNADLLRLSPDLTAIALHTSLPQGMRTNTLHADAKNVWATGFADLVPATDGVTQSLALESVAALIDDAGVSATLVIAGTDDADVLVGGDGLVLTSGGTAYRVTLPE